ncbi:prokaryotic transcription elongation factor, GreA/GreB, C-terminal domain protein [Sphingomonas sp. S17]|jgi:transcription elongation GreA/GreB family factor|uniref:GreA/GreB family elongation factor n=2 Tax=Sphingomonas paucimobilis TaxID=13689 RepID=A0A411LMR3_SPHPI|nr:MULTISPECIES: GreA/GreB family elongation factor [Sphingomonas]EGI55273.1 prokaryotic transcription elongation factor, GreA/GreB, C-terminal domain protein [Sphingomonas sp. S17]MBQ1478440.1 GreA/GreB family elongation factor [Sphingomonas sp.]MCM3679714.1 GreA/GreB family elongation factor [Sphingomonas paucimobilis]MDG5970893.1 GreA/GreB family elongation factor [Sphingomonas paucimobilis]NNG58380.1 nucleoside-diphosphate kinase [Sphingomonas paucimobilis]
MSVAFRRESDEEHLEPKFELPIPPGPNLVTPRGAELTRAKVAEVEAALAAATEEEDRTRLQRELRYWNTRAATAELAPAPAEDEVGIGSVVTIRLNGQTKALTIVGHDEADPSQDRIAYAAPLARALMGAMAGEMVAFGGKADAVEILDVSQPT